MQINLHRLRMTITMLRQRKRTAIKLTLLTSMQLSLRPR
jgi:hypothetical protein